MPVAVPPLCETGASRQPACNSFGPARHEAETESRHFRGRDGISMTELARGAMAWTGKVAAATAVLAMVGIAAPDARTPGVVTAASPDAAIGA